MTKTPFAGRAIHRQGGVLFIAAEGQAQIPIRLKGAAIGKVAAIQPDEDAVNIDPEKMPFVWAKRSPPLSDPEAFGELRAMVADAARGMQERFGLPLALIVIDALMPAAQFKDANDATEARQVMDMLAALGRDFDVLVIPIDHFGKDVSTGTRNSSGKEDAADTILALLGERSIEGKLSNPRMALRKVKGAEQGAVFPFEPREVAVGETDGGRLIKTFVIDWQRRSASAPTWCPRRGRNPRAYSSSSGRSTRRSATAEGACGHSPTARRSWPFRLRRCEPSS